MIVLRFKTFSKKEDRKERREMNKALKEHGVSRKDRKTIKSLHKIKNNPEKMKINEDYVSKDPETRKKANKKATRVEAAFLAPGLAIESAAAGHSIGSNFAKYDKKTGQYKGTKAGKGALIGAAAGAAAGLAASTIDHRLRRKESEKAEKYKGGLSDQKLEKGRDMIKVAKGEMSEAKYAKKYATKRIKNK